MPAPTYGSSYLEINSPLVGNPANAAEATPTLDPNFIASWNSVQQQCPLDDEGDFAFKLWVANVAYRYAMGTTTFTPTLTNISPTTGVHGVAKTITITGTKIDASAMPMFGGVIYAPTTRTPTSIVFDIPASATSTATTYPVTFRNSDGSSPTATNYTAT